MRKHTLLAALAVTALFAFSVGACKKKGKDEEKKGEASEMSAKMATDMAAHKSAKRPRPRPRPAKGAGLFDPSAIDRALKLPATKHANFNKYAAKIVEVAATCKKSKKYLSSLSWCDEWKTLSAELKKINEAVVPSKPETVMPALAATLAGVSKLRDKDPFVRYAGLLVLERAFYDFSYRGLKQPRKLLAQVVALSVKNGTDYYERKLAVRLLGHEGGRASFMGGVYDGKVLAWAAKNDKSKWLREAALSNLGYCLDKLKDKCPVTPSHLKAWFAKEKDKSPKEAIARLAGKLKMTDEVLAWCGPLVLDATFYWGCRSALKAVLDGKTFDKFLEMAKQLRDSDKSKTKGNFRMAFIVDIMVHGIKRGFPKEKVLAFLDSVLAQKATATMRTKSVLTSIVRAMVKLATTKKEIKAARKLLRKRGRKLARLVRKDKNRKDWPKVFKEADKKLKKKAKKAS